MKVVALHTSQALVARIKELWEEQGIQAELVNIIDDSLIWEVIRNNGPTPEVFRRMLKFAQAAQDVSADYIFNTCSSVGGVMDNVEKFCSTPIIKIDKPMALEAVGSGGSVGVLATLPSTLGPTCQLIRKTAEEKGRDITIADSVAEGAFPKYMEGKLDEHNKTVLEYGCRLAENSDIIVLAQGSMSLLAEELSQIIKKPVLSSPVSGVKQFLDLT